MDADRTKRVEGYRQTSREADEFCLDRHIHKTRSLLRLGQAAATEAGDEDYRLFFEAELVHYTCRDLPRSIELMRAALAWGEEQGFAPDHFLLSSMGGHHQSMEDHSTAIEWFHKALAAKPNDHDAMRRTAVSLHVVSKPLRTSL